MDIRQLDRMDLNLLVALQVLLEERSVSKAAERLYLTQSAMSKALGRLRDMFNDRLFTRGAGGMVPTPRAEAIAAELPELLRCLQRLVEPMTFDPLTYEGEFHIVMPEFVGSWVLPELMSRLQRQAPGLRVKAISRTERQTDKLISGELDLAIQLEQHWYPPEIQLVSLGFAPPMLLARKGHPLEGKELTWDMIAQYPQAQVYIPDLMESHLVSQLDSPFIQYESQVTTHFETSHLFTALQVVKHTDYLMPGPPMFIEDSELSRDIISLPLPGGEKVMLKYVLAIHERVADSLPHQFLRQALLETVEYHRSLRHMPNLQDMRQKYQLPY